MEKQTDKYIQFADADIAWSNGETSIIAGQETPEWQGFIATGTKQGMYRAVPCVDTKVNANAVRIVTVFAPNKEGDVKYKASCLVSRHQQIWQTQSIGRYTFDDGSEWTLDEEKLSQL